MEQYQDAYINRCVKAVPEPGSKYWTTPVAVMSSRACVGHLSASSDELHWNPVEEDSQELGVNELSAYLGAVNLQDWLVKFC